MISELNKIHNEICGVLEHLRKFKNDNYKTLRKNEELIHFGKLEYSLVMAATQALEFAEHLEKLSDES